MKESAGVLKNCSWIPGNFWDLLYEYEYSYVATYTGTSTRLSRH